MEAVIETVPVPNMMTADAAPASVTPVIEPRIPKVLRRRVSLKQTVINTFTMAHRGLLKVKHTPEQFADVLIQPIVFTLMFGLLFGGSVSGSVQDYLPILIPGILVMSAVSMTSVTGTQLREDMDLGVFDRFRSLPIAPIAPLAGGLLADVLRYVIATILVFVTGAFMGYAPGGGVGGLLLAGALVVITAWAISWIFALLGMTMRSAGSVQGLSFMVVMPLTMFSNAFVPVDTLPGWIQAFVKVNPLTYLISAVRELTISGKVTSDVWWTLIAAAAIALVFGVLTVQAYKRKA